jgi:hypothetical protein
MKEQMPMPVSAEEQKRLEEERQRVEDDERCAEFEAKHPELFAPVIETESREGLQLKFEALVYAFESNFSIEALRDITTEAEAKNNPFRESAKEALGLVLTQLKRIETSENKASFKKLSNAVGFINSGLVDHDR